jgi:hypothetical protein
LRDPVKNPCVITFYGASGENILGLNLNRILCTGAKLTATDQIGKALKWPKAERVMY